MASKRKLKKDINIICEALFAECVAASLYSTNTDDDSVTALLFSIIKLQGDSISRVSHVEPGIAPKDYFKALKNQFSVQLGEICDNINNLN